MGADAVVTSRPIPSPVVLRDSYQRQQSRLTVFFAFVLSSGLLVWLWLIASGFVVAHPWLVGGVVLALVLPRSFPIIGLLSKYRKRIAIGDATQEDLGPYSRELLQQIVHDVRRRFDDRVRPEVFILGDESGAYCRAMATRALFLRFIPPFNVVYFSRDLLDILRPDELRAVLAHEFAHHNGLNNLPGRASIATNFSIAAFILAALALCPWLSAAGFLAKALFVAVTAYVFRVLIVAPHNRLHRDAELLADLEASQIFGHLPMINALLRLSDRAEVVSEVYRRALLIAEGSSNPLALCLMTDCLAALPRREIRRSEVPYLMLAILPEKHRALEEKMRDATTVKRLIARPLLWVGKCVARHVVATYWNQSSWQKIDWHCFDTVHVDGVLDEDELPPFVRELNLNIHKGVALTPAEQEAVSRQLPNPYCHPSYRTRVLFINRARMEA